VGLLRHLEYLSLYNNNLTGEIPVSLGECRQLRVLALQVEPPPKHFYNSV
jgi:hypothetical protein